MKGIYCKDCSSVLLWYQFSLHFHSVYASVIFAALILQSAQDTAADCTTNCQNRFRRNATSDFNSDCQMGVLQSYVDCLANGSCLSASNGESNVEIGIRQNYEKCGSSYHGDYSCKWISKINFMLCLV